MPRIDWTRYEVHGTPQYIQVRIIMHITRYICVCIPEYYGSHRMQLTRQLFEGCVSMSIQCRRVPDELGGESQSASLHLR